MLSFLLLFFFDLFLDMAVMYDLEYGVCLMWFDFFDEIDLGHEAEFWREVQGVRLLVFHSICNLDCVNRRCEMFSQHLFVDVSA